MGVISLISLIICIMLQIIKILESSVQFLWDSKIAQRLLRGLKSGGGKEVYPR